MKIIRSLSAVLMFALALKLSPALQAQITLVNIANANDGGNAQDISLSGRYAYVAAGTNGLLVYDVSNPATPLLSGHAPPISTNSQTYRVVVSGNYAYATSLRVNSAFGGSGFVVYDISQPTSPSLVFSTNIYPLGGGIAVLGTNLYLGTDSRLPDYNLSNPAKPILVSNPGFNGNATRISAGSNYFAAVEVTPNVKSAEVGLLSSGIYAANFTMVNGVTAPGGGVAVAGSYAFITGTTNCPLFSELLAPTTATAVGQLVYPANNSAGVGYSVALSGNYAYLGCTAGLRVINIANPSNLIAVAETSGAYGGTPYGVAVSGPYVYVANGADGLRVFEVVPTLLASQSSNKALSFSWPTTASFALQQRSLTDTKWTTLTNIPIAVGGTNLTTVTVSGNGSLFRLVSTQ